MPELVDNELTAFEKLTRIDEELNVFWRFYRDEDATAHRTLLDLRMVALHNGATKVEASYRPSHRDGTPTAIIVYKVAGGEKSVTRL